MSVSQSPRMLVAYIWGWGFSSSVLSCLIRWQMERLSHLNNPRSNACRCFELGKMEFWHLKALCLYVSWRSEQILSWTKKKKDRKKHFKWCLNHNLFNTATKYLTSQGCSFLCLHVLLCLVQVDLSSPCKRLRWILTPPVSLKLDCFFFFFSHRPR